MVGGTRGIVLESDAAAAAAAAGQAARGEAANPGRNIIIYTRNDRVAIYDGVFLQRECVVLLETDTGT